MNKAIRKLTHWTLRRTMRHRWTLRRRKRGLLSLGICLNHRISRFSPFLRVAGDEYTAVGLGQALGEHCPEIGWWRMYDAKEAPGVSTDIVLVMWPDYPPLTRLFHKKAFWLQNGGWAARIPQLQEQFDVVFCASKLLCDRFAGLIYLPIVCMDPQVYHPRPSTPRFETEVCFLGNFSKEGRPAVHAARYLVPATEFRFDLWGSGWEEAEPPILRAYDRGRLPVRFGPVVYTSAKIILSHHSLLQRQDEMPSGRFIDALACEAFVISDYMPPLEAFSRYLVFTTGGEDLRDKIRHFLAHPEERAAKVQEAREFILHHHTSTHQAQIVARTLGLKWVDSPHD